MRPSVKPRRSVPFTALAASFLLALWLVLLVACGRDRLHADQGAGSPKRIPLAHIKNCIQVTESVFSGGVPEGPEAFEELQKLGIKTIISVDGMKPDVKTANRYHLRYVHLPHGYDGISKQRLLEIAKGLVDLPKPIFIHCHHGKHRSPAATASACLSLGWIDQTTALEVLRVAGTNPNYRGLFDSVAKAREVSLAEVERVEARFEEVASLPPLIETMVEMDEHLERLLGLDAAVARDPTRRSALADQVLLLSDHYSELYRSSIAEKMPTGYLKLLQEGEAICAELESGLRSTESEQKPLVDRLKSNCIQCHQQFRDNRPLERNQP